MKVDIKDMDTTEITSFLSSQKLGYLSLTDGDTPYSIPLAYSYDGEHIYLTLGPGGRKMDCITKNSKACFVVCAVPEDFGMANMSWTSVICDGEISRLTDTDGLTRAVRAGEKHLGMPEGAWNGLLEKTLKNPAASAFWKLTIHTAGGRKC